MKKHLLIITGIALFAFVFMTEKSYAAEINSPAPSFSLTDTNGVSHNLSDYQGSHVILEWINHDCPFVKKHYNSHNMQNLQRYAADNNVVWLSIASSAPGKQGHYAPEEWNQMTAEKNASPSAVLLDPSGDVGRQYGAQTTPHMYLINPEGVLLYKGAIDSTPSADPDDIEESENYVRSALDEALSGEPVSNPSTKAYGCSVKY